MARRALPVIFLMLFFTAQTVGAGTKQLVSKLLIVIGTATITYADLQVEQEIIKRSADSMLFAGQEANLTDKQVLLEMFLREIAFQQALKMGFEQVNEKLLDKAVDDFAATFSSEQAYLEFLKSIEYRDPRFDKTMEGNVEWEYYRAISYRFKEALMAKQFLNKKIGLQIRLTLSSKFEEEKGSLAAKHPGKSDEELKRMLGQEMFVTELTEWLKDVASRTKYMILDDKYKDLINPKAANAQTAD